MQSNSKDREELERSAWSWVEGLADPEHDFISEDNLQHSYRLLFTQHQSPAWKCKKNCRSNPRCYCSLGESQWLMATAGGQNDHDDEPDMSLEKKEAEIPVGLKNLGNTCYVNSFLQIWFHNVPFRHALYKWDPEKDPMESQNESLLEAENYRPCGKVASLQALFAMMEFSNRRAVDPNDLIGKLGLDPQVQQDAAEFSKLFISLLESSLSNQADDQVRSIVQNQFRGEYAYVTKCCKCKNESKTPSFFYELDLPLAGQKSLHSCLEDFLKEEKLEGDNQYFCLGCESKQDATRCVRLSQLPPVLNLQLNRFIFDMQTGRKKKLNSLVHFPEVLEMAKFLRQESSPDNTYHLTGVLMHVGAEANHGHYIAHIQETSTGKWFKFSDAHVEKLQEGRTNGSIGSEIDPLSNGKRIVNGSKCKNMQNSNNAYMLVYTSKSALASIRSKDNKKAAADKSLLPCYLQPSVEADIQQLEDDLKQQIQRRDEKQKEQESLKSKMKDLYERLPPTEIAADKFEFLPIEWLVRYFANPSAASKINLAPTTCVHGKLDLNKIQDVKAVNIEIVDQLFKDTDSSSGGSKVEPSDDDVEQSPERLGHTSLCEPCVRNRCRVMKLAKALAQHHKLLSEWQKSPVESSQQDSFWVGKSTLKKWRALARENLDERIRIEDAHYVTEHFPKRAAKLQVNGNGVHVKHEYFNSDIICQHGNLCIQEIRRKLVSKQVWLKLKTYFPEARDFANKEAKVCQSCLANDDKVKEAIEEKKELANRQKNALIDIFNERSRPSWAKPTLNKVYLVPRSFIIEWKSFVRSPQLNEAVKVIPNSLLICEHGGLLYPLGLDTESDYESVPYMVSEEEYSVMKTLFVADQDICVTRNKSSDDCDFLLESEPPACDECVVNRCKEEEDELLNYRNVTVYVRRLTGGEQPTPTKDLSDPDFDLVNGSGTNGSSTPKRFKLNNGHCMISPSCSTSDFLRRSNRRQKVRGEREFTVSSDMLLRDLKVKIMEAFKVAPFDQNLCLNGQYLTEGNKTLGQYRVLPKSLIYLRADEPNPSSAIEPDDGWTMQHPEEGFKGTGLLEGS